jgi:hypothetical protein
MEQYLTCIRKILFCLPPSHAAASIRQEVGVAWYCTKNTLYKPTDKRKKCCVGEEMQKLILG